MAVIRLPRHRIRHIPLLSLAALLFVRNKLTVPYQVVLVQSRGSISKSKGVFRNYLRSDFLFDHLLPIMSTTYVVPCVSVT
jgi:hypothetical protein